MILTEKVLRTQCDGCERQSRAFDNRAVMEKELTAQGWKFEKILWWHILEWCPVCHTPYGQLSDKGESA